MNIEEALVAVQKPLTESFEALNELARVMSLEGNSLYQPDCTEKKDELINDQNKIVNLLGDIEGISGVVNAMLRKVRNP